MISTRKKPLRSTRSSFVQELLGPASSVRIRCISRKVLRGRSQQRPTSRRDSWLEGEVWLCDLWAAAAALSTLEAYIDSLHAC